MIPCKSLIFRGICLALCLAVLVVVSAWAQGGQDTRPYAPIANPLPDTLDQLYRDSATIKIGRIRLNQAGYRPADEKYFYYVGAASSFSVVDAKTGANVATGTFTSKNKTVSSQIRIRASDNSQLETGGNTRYIVESPTVSGALQEGRINVSTPGQYKIRVGAEESGPFWVDENVYGWVRDAAVKFPGVNRCGDTESWFHGACHLKDATLGGWHDCGDHLKEGATQSYLHAMYGLASAALRDRDADRYGRNHNNTLYTDGVPDVLYEAKHGSDYILRAYDNAGGSSANISKMVTAVGSMKDHEWWGQPEHQDRMPQDRGGPIREARVELGTNVLGYFAAGLALTAKNYAVFDSAYAAKSVKVARELYAYAKSHPLENSESGAYVRVPAVNDKMAFAALGLLYATRDKTYLNDLVSDKTVGNGGNDYFGNTSFEGGWFAHTQPQFSKGNANTSWGTAHMVVLYGFYKLILKDEQMCKDIGIDSTTRMLYIGRTIGQMLINIEDIANSSDGDASIELPGAGLWGGNTVTMKYDDTWKYMATEGGLSAWMWNRYQFGNIFDLFAYSDMAMWIEDEGFQFPGKSAGTNWRGREVRQLMVRQTDYMLGNNPYDISMIYGIGHKNSNHPHHRAANPEGKNVPGAFYRYRPPVGALHSGPSHVGRIKGAWGKAGAGIYNEHYEDYWTTETGIDASATMIIPIMGLAKEDPITDPPTANVRTIYVGYDMAIIEVRQSRYGSAAIRFSADTTKFPGVTVESDSLGMIHRITLSNLSGGVTYYFDALIASIVGNTTPTAIKDKEDAYFKFTTLKTPPGDAEIANVKVCKVTSDSAEIFWFTPNGSYDSKVVYDTKKPPTANVQDGNVYGRPTQFHYVKIGGLKEKTTYYFYVESNGTRDNNGGQFYTFTTPVEHVEFDVRLLKYSSNEFGLNIVNQDIKDYDSLELRFYVRGPDSVMNTSGSTGRISFENHLGIRLDIGIKYTSAGFQDRHFKGDIDQLIQSTRVVRMDDTYNPLDGTWAYYVRVPMDTVRMASGSRFRVDLSFRLRDVWAPHNNLLTDPPYANILDLIWNSWSFTSHSRAAGDPADYPGIPNGSKTDIDDVYWNTPVNQYVAIYRKNEFIWGYSPSTIEQQTKKTHYEMTSQVTAPLFNPAEEYVYIEQPSPTVTVRGWAQVTENGVINDIWVNGAKLRDVSSVAQYDRAADRWNLTVPVPMKNTYGGNNVDITIFGGPEEACATCYGCAFTNHSFYVEFRGVEPFPSSMKLLDAGNQSAEVKDSAKIDGSTRFYVFVDDMNGNQNRDRRDTVYVSVVNPVIGDSIIIPLVETGAATGQFRSTVPITVVNTPPGQRGANEISMDGGQTIIVTYVDPTDPEDVSQVSLASRAEFAVPGSAWFKDSTGVGSIDLIYVKYSKDFAPNTPPDSLRLTVPGQAGVRVVKVPGDAVTLDAVDKSLVRFYLNPAIENVTGFGVGEQISARSFLIYNGAVREAVVPVRDSAGPALLDRAMLYEKAGGGYDTLQVTLSEPMSGASVVGGSLVLRRNGGDIPLQVVGVVDSSLITNSLTLVVNLGVNQAVREGDSVFINPTGPAVDRVGNRAHPSNRPVPVVLKTSAPRITAAVYRDTSADGIIDQVEFTLSKPLDLAGLRLELAWENGRFVPVAWERLSINEAQTVVKAEIAGLLTGDSIITGGAMRAVATHNRFPGDTLRANVADRAALVVRWAQFCPRLMEEDRDTLVVNFSEPLQALAPKPLRFLYWEDGAQYTMELENIDRRTSNTQTFAVVAVENSAGYPGQNDSAWINVDAALSDANANIQLNGNNRRVKLAIKPPSLAIRVIPAPNPFAPGVRYSGARPARVIVRPVSKVTANANIRGTVTIYDKLGNVVLTDTLKAAQEPGSTDLYYEWDGCNRRGRRAGSGTYLVAASVWYVQEASEKKASPATAKAMLYVIR